MAGNPEYQNMDAYSAPSPVTPAASPSSPLYDSVTPAGRGPAPYNIQAPLMDGEIATALDDANAVWGASTENPAGPRQQQAKMLLESPQGFGSAGFDIDAGFHGGGGESWPANVCD